MRAWEFKSVRHEDLPLLVEQSLQELSDLVLECSDGIDGDPRLF